MKNNFVLQSEKQFVPEDEVGQAVYDVCMNDSYLSESLRDEEITHIEGLIKKRIQEDSIKFIELKKLLDIVKRSSVELDEERLSAELLEEYGRWITSDCREEMKVLKDLLLITDIDESSIEEIVGRGSKEFKGAGVLRKETGFWGYTAANIFKSEETECYYVTNEDIVAKKWYNHRSCEGK